MVMEYAPSGSLLDYVRARKRLSEQESCFFLQQIVAGLQFCHANEVSTMGLAQDMVCMLDRSHLA